jgi:hypothetical protein
MIVGKQYILHLPITVSLAVLILKPPKDIYWLCTCLEYTGYRPMLLLFETSLSISVAALSLAM